MSKINYMCIELDFVQEEKFNFSNKWIASENPIRGSPHTSCGLPSWKVTSNCSDGC